MHSTAASQPCSLSTRLFKSRVSLACCSFRRRVSNKAGGLQKAEFFNVQVEDVYFRQAEQPVGLYVQCSNFS